jgi:hypothetical protein
MYGFGIQGLSNGLSNEYNPFGVDVYRTTTQGWVAKSATQPWAL